MEIESFQEATEDTVAIGTYIIAEGTMQEVMDDYYKTLERDGWEIVEDQRPVMIEATKEENTITVVPTQQEDGIKLTIVSK